MRTAADRPAALLMIDIDDFKQLNDRFGHPVGDDILRTIGLILRADTRHGVDLAARHGGEELAVILPETGAAAPEPAPAAPAPGPGPSDGEADPEEWADNARQRTALTVAERIRAAVERGTAFHPDVLEEAPDGGDSPASRELVNVTVSIGVAVFPTTAATMSELVAQATRRSASPSTAARTGWRPTASAEGHRATHAIGPAVRAVLTRDRQPAPGEVH